MTTLNIALPHDKRPFCGPDVLAYYDGPQLFWLPCDGRRLLAVGLPDEAGHWPFLVVELTEDQAQAVEGNRITMRAVFLAASAKWVMRDYDAETLVLEPLEVIPEDWLPGDVLLRLEGGTS
ncbi:hypothetical protein WJ96_07535 [Burkholderia ubonensis]|uniref:Uncharacterized protein n=1 Tax=Burkholderia ubonensis TaxID=101571 RepID=A0AAW3MYG7_9BURK|nr:hypothetical protein [Burkholderia ubonensis]KVP75549.1 hypothetical protein WJ93_09325 [Burkholderia ubonensis]KVP98363.1 hypothetical protein WJ96_07535 [Burkholderia ubonensis]KVZ93061.1 hypothetical protein WL25_19195 [Burkholderia ubonensis]